MKRIVRALAREVVIDGVDTLVLARERVRFEVLREVEAEGDGIDDLCTILAEDADCPLCHFNHFRVRRGNMEVQE